MKGEKMLKLKRLLTLVLLACVASSFIGCATAKKKFIRKRPDKAVQPVMYTEEEQVQKYSNKYQYTTHFTYWRTWHSELLAYLGQNTKREKRAAEEAVGHLDGMKRYLTEPKKSELETEIAVLKDALVTIERGMSGQRVNLTQKLERSQRVINSDFQFEKVKAFIVPDQVDLGSGS